MTTLTPREIDQLNAYTKKCNRTVDWFTFGPATRKDFDALKPILDKLGIGYFGSFGEKESKKAELPDWIYIHVCHKQAQKLSQVLISFNNKEELDFQKNQQPSSEDSEPLSIQIESEVKSTKPKGRWQSLAQSKSES
jgi:hypothetical protein